MNCDERAIRQFSDRSDTLPAFAVTKPKLLLANYRLQVVSCQLDISGGTWYSVRVNNEISQNDSLR